MGYYQGNGAVISRRATPVVHCIESVPTIIIDGVPQGFVRVVHTGVQKETVTRKAGVADPGDPCISDASITYSNTNPPHEQTFKGGAASRIGESNLFELIITQRNTTG